MTISHTILCLHYFISTWNAFNAYAVHSVIILLVQLEVLSHRYIYTAIRIVVCNSHNSSWQILRIVAHWRQTAQSVEDLLFITRHTRSQDMLYSRFDLEMHIWSWNDLELILVWSWWSWFDHEMHIWFWNDLSLILVWWSWFDHEIHI